MNCDEYEFVRVSEKLQEFSFQSIRPKGKIEMLIKFQRINMSTYNLAFGNIRYDGCIDKTYNPRNQDRNKILATVAAAVFRCRLYTMGIGNNLNELRVQFDIVGIRECQAEFEVFEKAPK